METMNKQSQDQHRSNNNQQRQAQKCPRCDSTNTKFCYYNNYSLSQPRYFCKTCRRYWTHGGTLRNVPVGGGCRKGSKRAKTSAASSPLPPLPLLSPPSASDQYTSPAMASSNFLTSATGLLSSSFADIQAPYSQTRDHHVLGVSPRASSASVSVSVSSAMMSLLQGLEQGQFYVGSNSSDQPGGTAARPNTAPVSFSSQQDHWPPQSFENMISTSASETAVWNIDAGDVRAGNTDSASGPSLVPNDMWPDLPRSYGSSPP